MKDVLEWPALKTQIHLSMVTGLAPVIDAVEILGVENGVSMSTRKQYNLGQEMQIRNEKKEMNIP